ncbi:MAG: DUF5615 family PIN-like protein [Chloroflexota bacterium]
MYLDECLLDRDLVRQLRSRGYSLYLASELGLAGHTDEAHLDKASNLGAVLTSQNQQDFAPLHLHWQAAQREHAGILLVQQKLAISKKIALLERAARLLTPETAHNQLMRLALFATEEQGQAFAVSLRPAI